MSWAQLSDFILVLLVFCCSYRLIYFITTSASINTAVKQRWFCSVLPVFQKEPFITRPCVAFSLAQA